MKRDEKFGEIFRDGESGFDVREEISSSEPPIRIFPVDGRKSDPTLKPPKDEFLGGAVVFFIGLSLLFGAGFFAYLGYRIVWMVKDDRVSIEMLGTETPVTEDSFVGEPVVVEKADPEPVEEKKSPDKATVEVVVLNGGAPSGTAGKVVKTLQDAGFVKAGSGNADKSRSMTEIFFKEGFEDLAHAVRQALSGTYGDVKISVSDPKDADTNGASITVVVAK